MNELKLFPVSPGIAVFFINCFVILLFLIILCDQKAYATHDLDLQYALENVGVLKPTDNIDSLFEEYVKSAISEYFEKQTRFVLKDLSLADSVLSNSKMSYAQIVEDKDILKQVVQLTQIQTLIKTKIFKEKELYIFSMDWLHSPKMDILASETFSIKESLPEERMSENDTPLEISRLKSTVQEHLDIMIRRVPFLGQVTGRDGDSVTLNLGGSAKIELGDVFVIGTIEEIKLHPLLATVVDWNFIETGKVEISQVEDGLSFGRILSESDDRKIGKYQKILSVRKQRITKKDLNLESSVEREGPKNILADPPTMGWVGGDIWIGSFSRQASDTDDPSKKFTGGGFVLGAKADSQVWFNRDWFGELSLSYGTWSFGQTDLNTDIETTAASANLFSWALGLGYYYHLTTSLLGPKGWLKVGYRSRSYSFVINEEEKTAPVKFKTPFLGIGGAFPVRENWGGILKIEYGVLGSGQLLMNPKINLSSASDILFYFGGFYQYAPRIVFKIGFEILANTADYRKTYPQGPVVSAISQKIFMFVPSILYYF